MRPGIWEILLIFALVLVLFGSAKIPGMAKNIANGINVFKKEVKGGSEKSERAPGKARAKKAGKKR
ncbi:MAG: twin-arginine translocase TatA/TatE family subunit [Rickettsiales bacterium]|nr:twin-arginine translocase TatA/TatE family subunit [Rickettsiales bacterium]